MKMQAIVDQIAKKVPLEKRDLGEHAVIKSKGIPMVMTSYKISDWGILTTLESKSMFGAARRDMLMISGTKRDIPVFVGQYAGMFGKNILEMDTLDCLTDRSTMGRYDVLDDIIDRTDSLDEEEESEVWYTELQMGGSCMKRGKKTDLEAVLTETACTFVEIANSLRECGYVDTRESKLIKLIDRMAEGGGFFYNMIWVGKQQEAKKLYADLFFGIELQ